jgi:hypothetical protein
MKVTTYETFFKQQTRHHPRDRDSAFGATKSAAVAVC